MSRATIVPPGDPSVRSHPIGKRKKPTLANHLENE
jgi:hypothetical protein